MIKKFVLVAAVMTIVTPSFAIDKPTIYDNAVINVISNNCQWAGSADEGSGTMTIINLVTNESVTFFDADKFYSPGLGNYLSDNGIAVGATNYECDTPSYYENGQWHDLPLRENDNGICLAQAITPDGSRICGQIGREQWGDEDSDLLTNEPVVWNRNEDGTYSDYILLPHPDHDFAGRTPQYITAVSISADGKTIAGQVVDATGRSYVPIVYLEDAEGNWSYRVLYDMNPDHVTIPHYPGTGPAAPSAESYMTELEKECYLEAWETYNSREELKPTMEQFMSETSLEDYMEAYYLYLNDPNSYPYPVKRKYLTDEEYAAYQQALADWEANTKYPTYRDYMSDESWDAYQAAKDEYQRVYSLWKEQYNAYADVMQALIEQAPSFSFNNLILSANGRYLATSDQKMNWSSAFTASKPVAFDLWEGTMTIYDTNDDLIACSINNDGVMMAGSPSFDLLRHAYISLGVGQPFMLLQDYIKDKNASLYTWIEDNMVHDYDSLEYDEELGDYVAVTHYNQWLTGTPYASADLSLIATWEYNVWDTEQSAPLFVSYILPTNYNLGIADNLADGKCQITLHRNGVIEIQGDVTTIEVYDAKGTLLFTASHPGTAVNAGLKSGLYIIKAANAQGDITVSKAAI